MPDRRLSSSDDFNHWRTIRRRDGRIVQKRGIRIRFGRKKKLSGPQQTEAEKQAEKQFRSQLQKQRKSKKKFGDL